MSSSLVRCSTTWTPRFVVFTVRVHQQRWSEQHVFISNVGQNNRTRSSATPVENNSEWSSTPRSSEQQRVVGNSSGTKRQRVVVDSTQFRTTVCGRRQVVDALSTLPASDASDRVGQSASASGLRHEALCRRVNKSCRGAASGGRLSIGRRAVISAYHGYRVGRVFTLLN